MELTLGYLDDATGSLLLDDELPTGAAADLAEMLGQPINFGCAKPVTIETFMSGMAGPGPVGQGLVRHGEAGQGMGTVATIRVAGYWHNSLVEGPGRRSVLQMQGCPIKCVGCWVPQTHDFDGGYEISIEQAATALLDPAHERDGVTVIGGEPFAQPEALWELVAALWRKAPGVHLTVYSGYTLERLERMAEANIAIAAVLETIDVLIDGKFNQAKPHSANCGCDDETRRWTGSCGQRVNYLIPF